MGIVDDLVAECRRQQQEIEGVIVQLTQVFGNGGGNGHHPTVNGVRRAAPKKMGLHATLQTLVAQRKAVHKAARAKGGKVAKRQLTAPARILATLQKRGPMSAQALAAAMLRSGWRTKSDNPRAIVGVAMTKLLKDGKVAVHTKGVIGSHDQVSTYEVAK